MDPAFVSGVEQLKQKCVSISTKKEDIAVAEYVAYLDETIASLEVLKAQYLSLQPLKQELSLQPLEQELSDINDELRGMGGDNNWSNLYKSLPENMVSMEEYFETVARYEQELAKPAHAFGCQKNQVKAQLMLYLEHKRPFDSVSYLQKKEGLLDRKLSVLLRLRALQKK